METVYVSFSPKSQTLFLKWIFTIKFRIIKKEASFPFFVGKTNKRASNTIKDEEKEKQQRIHCSTNSFHVSSILIEPNKDDLLHW